MNHSFTRISKIAKFTAFLLCMVILFYQCKRDEFEAPYVPVDMSINLSPDLDVMGNGQIALLVPTSDNRVELKYGTNFEFSIIINPNLPFQGNGIILYRQNAVTFYAFERTCTCLTSPSCAVGVKNSGDVFPVCPCCATKFFIENGTCSPIKDTDGVSPTAYYALTAYRTAVYSDQILTIEN